MLCIIIGTTLTTTKRYLFFASFDKKFLINPIFALVHKFFITISAFDHYNNPKVVSVLETFYENQCRAIHQIYLLLY